MIAVDTNILVYAHRQDSHWHEAADRCVTELAESSRDWGIPWPCVHEFFAIATHPRIYDPPTPLEDALAQIECWLEAPRLILFSETPTHWVTVRDMLGRGQIVGPKVHDARILGLCLQHGVRELWTADRDFSRMTSTVDLRNPLVTA